MRIFSCLYQRSSTAIVTVFIFGLFFLSVVPAMAAPSKLIPYCVFEDKLNLSGKCGDVSIFVELLLQITAYLFTIIGAIALAVFVYGGFILIVSQGSEEKIKKGTDALVAAVIGLAVAFGGYLLIQFLGQAIGLKEAFQLK